MLYARTHSHNYTVSTKVNAYAHLRRFVVLANQSAQPLDTTQLNGNSSVTPTRAYKLAVGYSTVYVFIGISVAAAVSAASAQAISTAQLTRSLTQLETTHGVMSPHWALMSQ